MNVSPFHISHGLNPHSMEDTPYREGLFAEGCSMPCVTKLLAEQARTLGENYLDAAASFDEPLLDPTLKAASRLLPHIPADNDRFA